MSILIDAFDHCGLRCEIRSGLFSTDGYVYLPVSNRFFSTLESELQNPLTEKITFSHVVTDERNPAEPLRKVGFSQDHSSDADFDLDRCIQATKRLAEWLSG